MPMNKDWFERVNEKNTGGQKTIDVDELFIKYMIRFHDTDEYAVGVICDHLFQIMNTFLGFVCFLVFFFGGGGGVV